MSYLLDTNICVAYLKGDGRVRHRFIQHSGRLFIPTVVWGELWTAVSRARAGPARKEGLRAMLAEG